MSKTSLRKRQRQLAQQEKQQEKIARREQRKEKFVHNQSAEEGDPDLAGMVPGPQHRRDEESN